MAYPQVVSWRLVAVLIKCTTNTMALVKNVDTLFIQKSSNGALGRIAIKHATYIGPKKTINTCAKHIIVFLCNRNHLNVSLILYLQTCDSLCTLYN